MVAVHFEERCAYDDDYGKKHPIRLFESREKAIEWLLSVGYADDGRRYVHHQYHSEMHANIHEIVGS